MQAAVAELITTYADLNSQALDELTDEPSALEFMRYVAQNRPFVVRGGASKWPACEKWNAGYLEKVIGNQLVNVAVTPSGNADSVAPKQNGCLCFVKPLEVQESFTALMNFIRTQELEDQKGEVKYGQTQNDNLRGEYQDLLPDVEQNIPWAKVALNRDPDAINFWIGNSRSVTALHRDNYENVYCQMIGQKHFVLIPPTDVACVGEQRLPAATYIRDDDNTLQIQEDIPEEEIPFATWDPDTPLERQTGFSHLCRPIRITLDAGDMLYLPAMWYHKVSQSCSEEGICCAVNYWYDMDFSGALFPLCAFAREIALTTD